MRTRLLTTFCMALMAMGLFAQAEVQILSDVTSKIQNADFSADEPVTEFICTYDYDMAKNGTTLFGMQPVTGWIASHPSDNTLVDGRTDGLNAKASGVFALVDPDVDEGPGLGGAQFKAPYANSEATEAGVTGPVLGMVAVWGSSIHYAQDITLPAGDYMMVATYYNTGVGEEVAANNNGFTDAGGTAQTSTRKSFPINVWEKDTVFFRLTAETAGQLTLGFSFGGGSGNAPHIYFDNVKLYNIATNYLDQKAVNEAKERLLALIEEGEGYGVDVSGSRAVYDNPNATMEEVLAAIEAQTELNAGGITDLSEFFIQNPHFSEGKPVEGGICTYDYDCEKNNIPLTNYSMLDVPGWTQSKTDNGAAAGVFAVGSEAFLGGAGYLPPKTLSDGVTTEANLLGVVTCWTMAAQYKQNVTLPAGKYTVGISYYNSGGANAVQKNLNGFVADDGTEYLGEIVQYPVGSWQKETITFELFEETTGYFSLGYQSTNTGSGNMPHLFVDGFSLVYVGAGINGSMLALNSAYNGGLRLMDEKFNADLKDKLQNALDDAKALIDARSEDEETNKAAATSINSLLADVNASIKAYQQLQTFFDGTLLPTTDKYEGKAVYEELFNRLSEMADEVNPVLDECTWTNEQIADFIASFDTVVKEEIQKAWDKAIESGEALEEDLDISPLFEQLAYTYSTSAVSNTNVPDKEWQYGDASNFKTQYGTAEVWNQSPFQVSRTLANLPAGKYTIKTKAFFRNADNETNLADYDPLNTPEAYLFAGSVKAGLTNVASLASEDLAELPGAADLGGIFVPNSQQGAYQIFNDEAYTDLLEKSVSTVLVSEGDLTFGVGADQMQPNSWVVWYTFSVAYNAPDHNALLDVLAALDEQALNLQSDDDVALVRAADDNINDAQSEYQSVASMSDDELKALISKYEDAIAYAEESKTLVPQIKNEYQRYTMYLMTDIESDEPNFNELIGNIDAALSDGFDDNEQIEGYIAALKDGWTAYVQYPVLETASLDEPGDITPVIYNAGFVDPVTSENNANGWDITRDGGNQGAANDTYEIFNANSFRVSQTIKGLEEGYYRIRVQAFYRAGDNVANADTLTLKPDSIVHAYVFGETATATYVKALKNVLERENEDGELEAGLVGAGAEVEVTNYKDYESFYVPNDREAFAAYNAANIYWNEVDVYVGKGEELTLGLLKNLHVTNDWCPFDNFKLYYLGTTAPTAIEAVEATDAHRGATAEAIYNLAGQRVQKAVKGLYIVNGKKVVVK